MMTKIYFCTNRLRHSLAIRVDFVVPACLHSLGIIFLLLFSASACSVVADTPAALILVTIPADASPTPTPFRPENSPSLSPAPDQPTQASPLPTAAPTLIVASPLPSLVVHIQLEATQTRVPCRLPNDWVSYVVRAGDSLYRLSQSYGISVAELQQANCMTGSLIYAGKSLYVPPWAITVSDTLTPSDAATQAAPAPTPMLAYNQPGSYVFSGHCSVITITSPVVTVPPFIITVDMCVASVDVRDDGDLRFNITWTAHVPGGRDAWATKGSDVGNPNMNVTDNLGNRYDHIGLEGIAGEDAIIRDGQTGYGSYLFPPAQPGATVFTFHDDDQSLAIGDIVLAK